MILQHLVELNQRRIVLASASPRRAELLRNIGLTSFEVIPSKFAEDLDKHAYGGPAGYACETARCKAVDVAETLQRQGRRPDLIIGADTIVEIDGRVLEKPGDAAEAADMLSLLSGRTHSVHTGVTLIVPPPSSGSEMLIRASAATTTVQFAKLSGAEIQAYIATGEPYDKAGGYGAQGPAGVWIQRIDGCYYNVMGLPLSALAREVCALLQEGRL